MATKNKKSKDIDKNILIALQRNQKIYDMLKNPPELSKKNFKTAKRWVVDLAKLMMS